MKTFASPTINGGQTFIMESVAEVIPFGRKFCEQQIAKAEQYVKEGGKIRCVGIKRDGYKGGSRTLSAKGYLDKWKKAVKEYEDCVTAIEKGAPEFKEKIADTIDHLRELVVDLEPQLAASHSGFVRDEDGVTAAPELVACGDDKPCFKRKPSGENVRSGAGEGAYRIIINTDVHWQGRPEDNAAVMGALVVLLQQFRPVEIWIQQGWLGDADTDGVTLFKLDFTAGFDPTQLAFWCGHPMKDCRFSFYVNRGAGRTNHTTSKHAELDADLFLRGDLLTTMGISEYTLANATPFEKLDLFSRWLDKTAMQIAYTNTDSFAM